MAKAEKLWQRIIEKGSLINENSKASLNLQPGASDKELQLLENTLKITLPEEVKSFYRIYNGQDWVPGTYPIVRNLTLSPISEIIHFWEFLQEEFDPDDGLEADIDKELKQVLWNSGWVPIAENGGGDYLCIDTDPAETGVHGQVLYFFHDWGRRGIEAASIFEFIENCLKENE
ncbi:SMI1/KNR4 family protein [Gracilibacillus ureilyticus]